MGKSVLKSHHGGVRPALSLTIPVYDAILTHPDRCTEISGIAKYPSRYADAVNLFGESGDAGWNSNRYSGARSPSHSEMTFD